jgi:protein involved in ribonucleotide reduction
MIIVYDSSTGLGKSFAKSLGYSVQSVEEEINETCILITRNVGLGKIPETTSLFLDQYKEHVVGVVVNGSKKFGPFFCKSGEKINKIYNLPIIRKISGSGNQEDLDFVKNYIKSIVKN